MILLIPTKADIRYFRELRDQEYQEKRDERKQRRDEKKAKKLSENEGGDEEKFVRQPQDIVKTPEGIILKTE